MLVVDELGHGGVGTADRALGILAQLEFTKSHCEGVNKQQPSDERFAFSQDELDDLCSLDDAH